MSSTYSFHCRRIPLIHHPPADSTQLPLLCKPCSSAEYRCSHNSNAISSHHVVVLLDIENHTCQRECIRRNAGVPPQMGLYAVMAGSFVYSIFGTSEFISKPILKK